MIPAEKLPEYLASVAHFHAMRPDLEGYTPSCAHCTRQQGLQCELTGEIRRRNADCNTGDFTFDERPLWEIYPEVPKSEWSKGDGMAADTAMRIKEYIAKGGSLYDLPRIRLREHGIVLVFPPGKRRDEYALPEEAHAVDGYQSSDIARTLQDRQAARAKGGT